MIDPAAKTNWLTFRLRTLFVVCFLAAMGLWAYRWVQWPARTLEAFNAAIAQKRYDDAAARLEYEHGYLLSPDDIVHRVHVANIVVGTDCTRAQPRSLADMLYGRRVYQAVGNQACFVDTGTVRANFLIESVTVERETIRFQWRGPAPHQHLRYENGQWVRDSPIYDF